VVVVVLATTVKQEWVAMQAVVVDADTSAAQWAQLEMAEQV
jgi:hypothetical protein